MLTYYDGAVIIEHSVRTKLDAERGVKVLDIKIKPLRDGVGVEVEALLDNLIETLSLFGLNAEFELIDVHNEIDQIAESYKQARRRVLFHDSRAGILGDEEEVAALRGKWTPPAA
jgi:hypothetical protein